MYFISTINNFVSVYFSSKIVHFSYKFNCLDHKRTQMLKLVQTGNIPCYGFVMIYPVSGCFLFFVSLYSSFGPF